MGKQKFFQYKTLVFFYENKCFLCVKLLFPYIETKVSSARNCLFLIYLDTFFVYKRNQ